MVDFNKKQIGFHKIKDQDLASGGKDRRYCDLLDVFAALSLWHTGRDCCHAGTAARGSDLTIQIVVISNFQKS